MTKVRDALPLFVPIDLREHVSRVAIRKESGSDAALVELDFDTLLIEIGFDTFAIILGELGAFAILFHFELVTGAGANSG